MENSTNLQAPMEKMREKFFFSFSFFLALAVLSDVYDSARNMKSWHSAFSVFCYKVNSRISQRASFPKCTLKLLAALRNQEEEMNSCEQIESISKRLIYNCTYSSYSLFIFLIPLRNSPKEKRKWKEK